MSSNPFAPPGQFRSRMLCVGVDLQLSPKLEDRVARYRFVHVPGTAPQGVPGDLWHESAVAIFGVPGQFMVGGEYTFTTTTTTEA